MFVFFFSSRRRHTRYWRDWSSDVCSSDLGVDRSLVLERDRGDGRGQREDDMEIGRRQELDLPGGEPFGSCLPLALRAMPVATRVVGDAGLAAILAPLDMTAQR